MFRPILHRPFLLRRQFTPVLQPFVRICPLSRSFQHVPSFLRLTLVPFRPPSLQPARSRIPTRLIRHFSTAQCIHAEFVLGSVDKTVRQVRAVPPNYRHFTRSYPDVGSQKCDAPRTHCIRRIEPLTALGCFPCNPFRSSIMNRCGQQQ